MYTAKLNCTFKVMMRLLCCLDFLAGGNDHVHTAVILKLPFTGTEGGKVVTRCGSILLMATYFSLQQFVLNYKGKRIGIVKNSPLG